MTMITRALRTWWDCTNCGNTNPPKAKQCTRCGQ